MAHYGRDGAMVTLAGFIKRNRPELKAAALAGDGETYGRIWRAIEAEARRHGLSSTLAAFRSVLSPDALRSERL